MVGLGLVEASTLGWTAAILAISTEVRAIGVAVAILAITLLGIRIFFRRDLEDIGTALTAFSVGGALVGSATAAAPSLLGFVGATPVVSVALSGPWVGLDLLLHAWMVHAVALMPGLWLYKRYATLRRG
jgi:hypothetical protein